MRSRHRLLAALTCLVAAVSCGGCGGGRPAAQPTTRASPPSATASHLVVLVMENREYADVIGRPDAPYTNSLATRSAVATNDFAIRHPSLPNYIALIGGSTFGAKSDCTTCHYNAPNIVDQLEHAGISWKAYMEDMPRRCYPGAAAGRYSKKHNPFLYFDDVATSLPRCDNVVPSAELQADLRTRQLPTFAWITPNLCNDMHDCSTAAGDRYLAATIPALLDQLGPHGRLYLVWDEGTSDQGCCAKAAGGHVPLLVAGPDLPAGTRWQGSYDHYSVLRNIEDALGLPRLGDAGCPCTNALPSTPTPLSP